MRFFRIPPTGVRGQNVLLLGSSYLFLGWWDWAFLGLLLLSTVVDFTVALRLSSASVKRRKTWLLASLLTNLGVLFFFKYFNFFIESAAVALEALGFEAHLSTLNIILPVGISFYTFQTMAYTIDVYRGKCELCRSPLRFAVYVCYFPQLVAGPIERAQHLLPQFAQRRTVDWAQVGSGGVLVLIGLVRKVAVADVVAPSVDAAFGDPAGAGTFGLWIAVFLFAIQIYGDFAGYSDVARGLSRMLGVELMENFNHPYFSTNITVFWRRWHISLSTWLRDYLYISLGGNRGSQWMVYRNLMLTMLLGGLWHGAAWTFVVWGALHGVALAVHKLWLRGRRPPDREPLDSPRKVFGALAGWAATMALVGFAWIFFRADSFADAFAVLSHLLRWQGSVSLGALAVPLFACAALLVLDLPQYLKRDHNAIQRWPWVLQGGAYALMVLCIVLPRASDAPFIYFQF